MTLGAGSAAASVVAGASFGYKLLWVQPVAMFLGVMMLAALGNVVLTTGERPYKAFGREMQQADRLPLGLGHRSCRRSSGTSRSTAWPPARRATWPIQAGMTVHGRRGRLHRRGLAVSFGVGFADPGDQHLHDLELRQQRPGASSSTSGSCAA